MKPRGPVGRFQIMALLQAARAHLLGLPEPSAYSFGLNRAIFYAAAKRGFKKKAMAPPQRLQIRHHPLKPPEEITARPEPFYLGDEMAYAVKLPEGLLFVIGGEVQTPEDFQRQVANRFGPLFPEAWQEALDYLKRFEPGVLRSQRAFFDMVYRPVRDTWAAAWNRRLREEKA